MSWQELRELFRGLGFVLYKLPKYFIPACIDPSILHKQSISSTENTCRSRSYYSVSNKYKSTYLPTNPISNPPYNKTQIPHTNQITFHLSPPSSPSFLYIFKQLLKTSEPPRPAGAAVEFIILENVCPPFYLLSE